ncbi:unnamed protein product [Spirodela intermedia]|uniref:1-phosphatidylinositol 4-kinase n=1 Tax=Spirodela intermedia TaxID=51605 RepID=A0A7I8JQR0_SPIIN|nr:unnamed protein product [Spirodela intermedia]CAA6672466.1 unnamed protein product [Spirodela intermedia]
MIVRQQICLPPSSDQPLCSARTGGRRQRGRNSPPLFLQHSILCTACLLTLESPIQTQMAVAVHDYTLSSEYHSNRSEGKPVGRRRHVFAQADTACVLGIGLDQEDNVHTVKRRLQLALNLPTGENSFAMGDLSAIFSDPFPLLGPKFIHRSFSTPCLFPTGRDLQQRDQSGTIEIICCSSDYTCIKQLVGDVAKAIKSGVEPTKVHHGLGGAYYFRNSSGDNVAIVKPADEEPFAPNNPKGFVGKSMGQPGLKRSVRVGETGFREVAAYLLDYDHFASVPQQLLSGSPTLMIQERKQQGICKIASFQQFIPHDFDASDYGASSFPVAAVHRVGILDIRIFNTDRHGGNLLVRKLHGGGVGRFGSTVELIPIDHGLCLPENLEDPYFEWIHWPQASIPFSDEELEYIAKLDPAKDAELLRAELPMIHEACLRVLALCTIFLKEAAAFGLCLSEIGEMMSREFRGMEEGPSELEVVCMEARRLVGEAQDFSPRPLIGVPDEDQFHDCTASPQLGFCGGSSFGNPLWKLEETVEEENDDDGDGDGDGGDEEDGDGGDVREDATGGSKIHCVDRLPSIHGLSMSLKGVGLANRSQIYKAGSSSGSGLRVTHRSADEQLAASASFVKLADMGGEDWAAFLTKFQELLPGPSLAAGQRHQGTGLERLANFSRQWRHRLGTKQDHTHPSGALGRRPENPNYCWRRWWSQHVNRLV